ncbi:AraC-like DNA-binding protein [Lacibacter cauensis]|uniref:AraC-like DNA-binding protein n=1 Tax=Lacibacter cauensis TaxID=510947 RepID=A0A562SFW7_9BACT|nr:helix-turn-helix domain-containing protein [Lacibacter cauensis]TWI80113.1 AraC-like DNA-binding protein [Lacibacter cauensis]TWI85814.1 AraC-like DNA-binding protein [Lacibacter cauensis]
MEKKKHAPVFAIADYCNTKEIRSIKISSFQEEACTIAEIEEGHRQNYYEIVWLKKGSGNHVIDTIDYPYAGSVLFMLSPGQLHRIFPKEKAEGFVIKFLPSLFSDSKDMDDYLIKTGLFDNIQTEPVIKLTASVHAVLDDVLNKMETEFNANEEDKEKIMLAYLKILITHISRLKKINTSQELTTTDVNFSVFQKYKREVEKKFRTEHSVQAYAEALSIQPRTLNSLSKKYTAKTAGDIIADRIILEAKRELSYNSKSIKEIGYELGFDDPAYFTRFFKKQTGISPQEFKATEHLSSVRKTAVG